MKNYPWGKVIETIRFNIDGHELKIVKYHPDDSMDLSTIAYGCDEISQSADSMMQIILAWMVYKQLGMNQGALTQGIARMLKLVE